ncbi:hypothetical protein [Kitasatospora cineracea]|uniref:Uncharacterized protein n=1 Tax=Kitasatospora cineracea TaxID=88074 RepID=A0A3N4RR60_9ACTN|nr:hypothetical protein [Kitasatospora cineracea]RPE33215.1 hypothetical protein EDD38_1494 [Kitasatospora cineracea]
MTICKRVQPIHLHHLRKTIPPRPFEHRISPRVLQWERTPEPERRAILAELAERDRVTWLKREAEIRRRRDTPAAQQRRRVEAFAAVSDLPSVSEFEVSMREVLSV